MITYSVWSFWSFFHFLHCNVPNSYKQKWGVLFFTCIKLVARILACVCAIACIKWRRLTSFHNLHFMEKSLSPHFVIILHGDMKCVFLIVFPVQNLITSDNPISLQLWWIWNSAFWLWVENLKKYIEYDKRQNIRGCTKYKR